MDIRTKLVIDIISTFALRKMLARFGWGEFVSLLPSSDRVIVQLGSFLFVLQAWEFAGLVRGRPFGCGVVRYEWCGGVAWTYIGESANLFSCVVKEFLALSPVQSGGLDAWEAYLGKGFAQSEGQGPFLLIHENAYFKV